MDDKASTKGLAVPDEGKQPGGLCSWIDGECCQTALRAINTVVFEYDLVTFEERVSPYIGEYIAGDYNGHLLSNVMLRGDIIHPDDVSLSLRFREKARSGDAGEMKVRLLTPSGEYHWFRMCINVCGSGRLLVGTLSDIDEEMQKAKLLQYRAEFDSVSGIYNKDAFYRATKRLMEADPDKPHLLLRFDIDRFKIVNDLYSVSEGDRVLRYVGDSVRSLARAGETYARMGNDVFCMCLDRTEPEALSLVERLEQQMNEYPLAFQFVLSVGIVHIPRYEGQQVNLLCDRAALAQRTVKGSYVRRCAFYEDWMGDSLNWEHKVTGYMREAIHDGQFQAYFQPEVDIRNGRMIGAEVLTRWVHPTEGMIMPGDFIPLFEKNGFILKLDEYIWETASRYIRRWLD